MIDLRLLAVETAERDAPADRAAALRRLCGHARGEAALLGSLGYRFYPMPGADLPHFLNKRLPVGEGRTAAVTLLAGVDPTTGRAVLEDCRSAEEARRELEAGPGGLWLVRLTVGNATVGWPELTAGLARRDSDAFSALAAEMLSLPLNLRRACALCAGAA